jgi:hypothetical protein
MAGRASASRLTCQTRWLATVRVASRGSGGITAASILQWAPRGICMQPGRTTKGACGAAVQAIRPASPNHFLLPGAGRSLHAARRWPSTPLGVVHVAWTVGEDPAADIHFASSKDAGRSFGIDRHGRSRWARNPAAISTRRRRPRSDEARSDLPLEQVDRFCREIGISEPGDRSPGREHSSLCRCLVVAIDDLKVMGDWPSWRSLPMPSDISRLTARWCALDQIISTGAKCCSHQNVSCSTAGQGKR